MIHRQENWSGQNDKQRMETPLKAEQGCLEPLLLWFPTTSYTDAEGRLSATQELGPAWKPLTTSDWQDAVSWIGALALRIKPYDCLPAKAAWAFALLAIVRGMACLLLPPTQRHRESIFLSVLQLCSSKRHLQTSSTDNSGELLETQNPRHHVKRSEPKSEF